MVVGEEAGGVFQCLLDVLLAGAHNVADGGIYDVVDFIGEEHGSVSLRRDWSSDADRPFYVHACHESLDILGSLSIKCPNCVGNGDDIRGTKEMMELKQQRIHPLSGFFKHCLAKTLHDARNSRKHHIFGRFAIELAEILMFSFFTDSPIRSSRFWRKLCRFCSVKHEALIGSHPGSANLKGEKVREGGECQTKGWRAWKATAP